MKTLKTFEFKSFGGAGSTHDWDTLLDGKIYQLEEGTDYECKTSTMGMMARTRARSRGMLLKTSVVEGGIVIQASPASEEQIAEWATKDEEREKVLAQRKADKKAAAETNGAAEPTEEAEEAQAPAPKAAPVAKPVAPKAKPVAGKR